MDMIAQNLDVVGMVMAVMALLSGLQVFLGWLKDKTASKADDKVYEMLSKGITMIQKLLDIFMGNPKHK